MFQKMKRGLALILAGTMLCAALAGCSGNRTGNTDAENVLQVQPEMYDASYWASLSLSLIHIYGHVIRRR